MVGFNRRFAEPTRKLKRAIADGPGPVMLDYRVNVDDLAEDHWLNDPDAGGGRIVGELCHFIDFARFVADDRIEQVSAITVDGGGAELPQNVQINVSFGDASTAGILYTTLGDSSLPKERVEGFGNGRTATVNNYKKGRLSLGQDKGHERELRAFVDAILSGQPSPIPFNEAVEVTDATLQVYESLRRQDSVRVDASRYL